MDVDNLLAGQRFDQKLAEALAECDVLIAIMGPRWMGLLKERAASGERDYVREEIAEALRRKIVVIPVRVGREGQLASLPRRDDLSEDIRDLVLYQKHDVAYERFGRDIAELIEAITVVRRTNRPQLATRSVPWGWVGATAASVMVMGYAAAYYAGVPVPWPGRVSDPPGLTPGTNVAGPKTNVADKVSDPEGLTPSRAEQKQLADSSAQVKREQEARTKAETDATKARRDLEARQKADAEAAAKRRAEDDARAAAAAEAERQRLAAALKAREEAARRVPQPGQVFRDCADGCPEMVVVPAGSFTMGSNEYDSEKPTRTVNIRQPFAVGKFEVTFAEWEACVAGGGCASNRSPSDQGWGKGRRPVINVSWNDAKEYVAWLSRKTSKTYRLLSEAEWEYAARAKSTGRWTFGDNEGQLGEFGWYSANSGGKTQSVGGKRANSFGLHDMHGNVWEWCEDTWHSNYNGAPNDGSAWTIGGSSSRVLRGGSWVGSPQILRSAVRDNYGPTGRDLNIGFRVARTL